MVCQRLLNTGHYNTLNTEADMKMQMSFLLARHSRHLQNTATPLLIFVLKSIVIFHSYMLFMLTCNGISISKK